LTILKAAKNLREKKRTNKMTNRSANATIKGYFYQFDHTILQILQAASGNSTVVIEGIEDVDIEDGDDSVLVQCKYYEGTEYNHPQIKKAVVQMLRHYHKAGFFELQELRYRLYGHYKGGQDKLKSDFDLAFLKKYFLTSRDKDKTQTQEHEQLKLSDEQLVHFRKLLEININAPSYGDQQILIMNLLKKQIPSCQQEDAAAFYYPNAINVIQSLAVMVNVSDRKITKAKFLEAVNRKEIVFSRWLHEKFGDEQYAKSIKHRHFKFASTKVPCASRIFILDTTGEFDISKVTSLLVDLGRRFSHVEHKSTPQKDRFCPYVILRDLPSADLIALLTNLLHQGIKFEDGYPFNGADFHPAHLAAPPTKENLIQLKFIPDLEQVRPLVAALKGSYVEIFDFFKSDSVSAKFIPPDIPYHAIKIPSTYLIKETF
jgi:hypothetical protein